jgi:tetratricopeptide (TPR) repeat protein
MRRPAESQPEQRRRGAYSAALTMLHTGQGMPMAVIEQALLADPGFVSGHCLRAALLVMTCRDDARPELARTLDAAKAAIDRASERERRHLEAAGAWLENDLKRALHLYGEIVTDHPHDTLALRVAHFGDLQWGRVERLRDRVAGVLPHWHEGMEGYTHVLGMYAFGLAEAGDYELAEQSGRRALELDRANAGAIHAVAHVLEMQGRVEEGVAWLNATARNWTRNAGYAPHLWWHLALYHLDLADTKAALRIYDQQMHGGVGQSTSTLVDASALLWRLQLRGVDVAARWRAVAEGWTQRQVDGLRPFNDTHAMLAFVAAERRSNAERLIDELRSSAVRSPDLHDIIHGAAVPVCEALMAFGSRDYEAAAATLLDLRHLAKRCGGSGAQCDLLHLTLVESALRSGHTSMARSLVAERIASRPHSVFNQHLMARARGAASATHRAAPRVPARDSSAGLLHHQFHRPPSRRPRATSEVQFA